MMLTLLTYQPVGNLYRNFLYSIMFMRKERVALLLLAGVAVTVLAAHLVLSTVGKQPFAHPFSNTSADGELVFVEGTVDRAEVLANGGHLVLQVKNLSVFIPSQAAQNLTLHEGDIISAYGTVQTYRGKKEIVVNSRDDIRVAT
jgi:DNA/RNA endonuclease YhcR with UshA esterase domain